VFDIAELTEAVQDRDLPFCGEILFPDMVQSSHMFFELLRRQEVGVLIDESLEATPRKERHKNLLLFENIRQYFLEHGPVLSVAGTHRRN